MTGQEKLTLDGPLIVDEGIFVKCEVCHMYSELRERSPETPNQFTSFPPILYVPKSGRWTCKECYEEEPY